jgi:hypothetical protein
MDNVKCKNCSKMGHFGHECTEPRNMAKVQCCNCDEFGHTGRECPNLVPRRVLQLQREEPLVQADLFVHFIACFLTGVPALFSARPIHDWEVTPWRKPQDDPSFLSRIQKSPSEGSHWSFRLSTSLHLESAGKRLLAQWMITAAADMVRPPSQERKKGVDLISVTSAGKAHLDKRLLIDWR